MLDKKLYFPRHLHIFLIYSCYLSATTCSFFSRALVQSLSSQLFISQAYMRQSYTQVFGCPMSEPLPTIKMSYTFRRKKKINGCCSNFTKRKEDKLSLMDRQSIQFYQRCHSLAWWVKFFLSFSSFLNNDNLSSCLASISSIFSVVPPLSLHPCQ